MEDMDSRRKGTARSQTTNFNELKEQILNKIS